MGGEMGNHFTALLSIKPGRKRQTVHCLSKNRIC